LFPRVEGTFDDRISLLEPDDAVKLAKEMLHEARKDPRVSVAGGGISLGRDVCSQLHRDTWKR